METLKEKAIREAYGEHWEKVKAYVNENGWCNYKALFGEMGNSIGYLEDLKTDVLDNYHHTYCYYNRPKSLKGIENNNGWTRIESEDDLPTESGYYEVCKDGIPQKNKSYYEPKFSGFKVNKGSKKITHWKKPLEIKPPIY